MSSYKQTEFDLRLSREVSHARTYPQQEKEPESSTGIDPLSGRRCYDSPEMYTQRGLLRKMYQPCDLKGLPWSYKISARSGMWENFIVYPLVPVAALRIKGTESGSWPTPTATERSGINTKTGTGGGLTHAVKTAEGVKMKASQLWPTPTANEDAAGTPNGKMQRMLGNHPSVRGSTPEEWSSGTLNPQWVEWLQGYPDGWTDLNSLETP